MSENQLKRRLNLAGAFQTFVPLLALIALVIATAICEKQLKGSSNFLKFENVFNILRNFSAIGIVALGMTFAIIAGGIDLSVGSVVAMSACIGVWLMNVEIKAASILADQADARQFHSDLPFGKITEWLAVHFVQWGWAGNEFRGVLLAVVTTLAVGTLAGLINGVLITKGRLVPFIATLAGMAAYRSIPLSMADGSTIASASKTMFQTVGRGGIELQREAFQLRPGVYLTLPYPFIIFIALAILYAVLLNKTRFGRYLIAIGNNERAAIYSAINVDWVKLRAYTLVGFSAGVAAFIQASRLASVSSAQAGEFYELDAITAVVIGGTRMTGGSGTLFGTVIGVLTLGVINNMLNFLGVTTYLQGLVKGVIIIVAVLVQRIGRKSS